jgi:hypothetical protein
MEHSVGFGEDTRAGETSIRFEALALRSESWSHLNVMI